MGEGGFAGLSLFLLALLSAIPGAAFLLESGENQSSSELPGCIRPRGAGGFWAQERFLHP